MNNLKLTVAQKVATHVDTLSQATVCKLVGLMGAITHHEKLGASNEQLERNSYRKIEADATSEAWLIKTFINEQSKRAEISKQIIARWQYRNDKD